MDGLLVIDKPGGMTSHDVVSIVRRATGERSVGHLGTLDPMATGVLPLLLGRYTRLAQFFGAAEKSYTGDIRFGWATDSFDADGEKVGEASELRLGLDALSALAAKFHGEIDQMPPVFSAKKIGGVPAHKLARAGKEVKVKPARITIHSFALTGLRDPDLQEPDPRAQEPDLRAQEPDLRAQEPDLREHVASFAMTVSAGGYVRSVAHELGQLAGCGAHLAALRRTRAGAFGLERAITVDELKRLRPEEIIERMPHPRTLLPEMPSVTVDDAMAGRLRNGMQANVPEFSNAPLVRVFTGPRELFCIGKRIAGTLVHPMIVLG